MRLLLDEHLSPNIAEQLRSRGHDVIAVTERSDLTSLLDRPLVERMMVERRAIVSNDVADHTQLFVEMLESGVRHYGLLLTSDRSMPRTKAGIGLFVRILDTFLSENPADEALLGQLRWLP